MKNLFFVFTFFISITAMTQTRDTVYVADFGARPYSYENNVGNIQTAIDACKRTGAKVLVFEKGRYDIWPEDATRREYFVSNTSSETEAQSKIKTIGMMFDTIHGLTIEGNGATLVYHGKMTTVVMDHCKNVHLKNLRIDFQRPAVSELTYTKVNNDEVEVSVHPDTWYQIVDGKIHLLGEGWRSNKNHCVEYHPGKDIFTYSQGWSILEKSSATEINRNHIRFKTPESFQPEVGNTLTVRDIIRDQSGMLILECKDITFSDIFMHSMGGIGIMSQYTENITMQRVTCAPPENSGRLLASSADMMHFSGCRGKITIDECLFSGGQDDPVNVHGTNLRIMEKMGERSLRLRFMHHQSYGFNVYFPRDEVAFVNASTMLRYATANVVSVKRLSDREVEVQLDKPLPPELNFNHDCLENLTYTPELEVRNSYFTHTNTRGLLVTTPRKVVIEGNTFHKTGMSAILIEGDAEGWYESGPVKDVWIKNNTFVDCGYNGGPGNAIIAIHPSNTVIDANNPVHKNIRIENNIIKTFDYPVLYAKSTGGLVFKNNTIERTNTLQPASKNQNLFYLDGCKDVQIENTKYVGDVLGRNIKRVNMKESIIDRKAVVDRHKILTTNNNPNSPAQVGNGEFAMGVDITGLQTFNPHFTMSHWSWHSFPLPEGLKIDEFEGKIWDTHGRAVRYDDWNDRQPELSSWLSGNPHRFNLGRIGLLLKKKVGTEAKLEDLNNTFQEVDLWTGIVTSKFELEENPVIVTTVCHAGQDVVGVKVESPLLEYGQIMIEISFPYPDKSEQVMNTFNQPNAHTTRLTQSGDRSALLEHVMDDCLYYLDVRWESDAHFVVSDKPHFFQLVPDEGKSLTFSCRFSEKSDQSSSQNFSECLRYSMEGWESFWKSGAAIDFSKSKDSRWKELERRVILSQYLMKVNEAGEWPPQESGLINNGWFGRFHFEMIWWHSVHYALWNRWPLFEKSLHVFHDFLPTSIERAKRQGFNGARWPKCTGNIDRDWPHHIHATLIWQQPHPIYFAELDYRLHPEQATLDKWKEVVFETAEFMADFAYYDNESCRYVLGPQVYIVSENTNPKTTINPTFELEYWRFGLQTALLWCERLNLPKNIKWADVLKKLSPLPTENGVYVTYEGIPDMWTKYAWEHPGLIGIYGMLPGEGVDTTVFIRTLNKVFDSWDFDRTWGWDFPMIAMAAARSGIPEKAVDMLLYSSDRFQFDEHGLATGGPFPYFPSNGSLLTAIAMMVAGWDGALDENAPGFPKDGTWVVKWEGFNKIP